MGSRHRALVSVLLMLASIGSACAQTTTPDQQLWIDGIVGKNFSGIYMAETEFSYQLLLRGNNPWVSYNASPSLERSMGPHWDLMVGVPLSYTAQDSATNTFETRLQFGARVHFTPFKRVQTRLLARYEQRYLTELEPVHETEQSARARIRAEVIVPLDVSSYASDSMWYALADFETFITLDRDLHERFANRTRARFGIGRKFSYNVRAEFIYCYQRSRTAIDDTGFTDDSIFRLRFKYYFTPRNRRPSTSGDNAN